MSDAKPGQMIRFWPVKRNSPGEYPGTMTALPAILAHLEELEDGSKKANVLVIEKGASLTPIKDVKWVEGSDDQPDDEQFASPESYEKTEGKDERIEKEAKELAEKREAEEKQKAEDEEKRKAEAEVEAEARRVAENELGKGDSDDAAAREQAAAARDKAQIDEINAGTGKPLMGNTTSDPSQVGQQGGFNDKQLPGENNNSPGGATNPDAGQKDPQFSKPGEPTPTVDPQAALQAGQGSSVRPTEDSPQASAPLPSTQPPVIDAKTGQPAPAA